MSTEPLTTPGHAPDLPALSAYLDGELAPHARQRLHDHLAACPLCAARLDELRSLSARFKALPEEPLGFDLGGVIEGRLAALPRPRAVRRTHTFGGWPVAIGAALSIGSGLILGSMLTSAGMALAPRTAIMRVFEPMPPGSLCIGLDSCYLKASAP